MLAFMSFVLVNAIRRPGATPLGARDKPRPLVIEKLLAIPTICNRNTAIKHNQNVHQSHESKTAVIGGSSVARFFSKLPGRPSLSMPHCVYQLCIVIHSDTNRATAAPVTR